MAANKNCEKMGTGDLAIEVNQWHMKAELESTVSFLFQSSFSTAADEPKPRKITSTYIWVIFCKYCYKSDSWPEKPVNVRLVHRH